MRFVHSLDDSVLGPLAGGLAATVAAITALVSGPALFSGDADTAYPNPHSPEVAVVGPLDDSASGSDIDSSLFFDTGDGMTSMPDLNPVEDSLCGRVLNKEADVDTMNDNIDTILRDMKSGRGHRRR